MQYGWHDLSGNLGVAMIVGAYLLLQLGRMRGDDLRYSMVNAVGAALVLVSLAVDFNLSAFVIELFWLAISLFGAARWLYRRRTTA